MRKGQGRANEVKETKINKGRVEIEELHPRVLEGLNGANVMNSYPIVLFVSDHMLHIDDMHVR